MISIIIPTYNTGKKLNACLKSLLEQTYNDLEVILIDDCSNDRETLSAINYWANKDNRVTVIHNKTNQGIEKNRLIALAQVHGEYLMFMDHDDWYPSNYTIERMMENMKTSGADVVMGQAKEALGPLKYPYTKPIKGGLYSHKDFMEQFYDSYFGVFNFSVNLWDKVYKMELVKNANLHPRGLKYTDDACFNMFVLPLANSISIIDDVTYIHRYGGYSSKYTDSMKEYMLLYAAREEAMQLYDFKKGTKPSTIQMRNVLEFDIQLRITHLHEKEEDTKKNLKTVLANPFWEKIIRSKYILECKDDFTQALVCKDIDKMYKAASAPVFTKKAIARQFLRRIAKPIIQLFI